MLRLGGQLWDGGQRQLIVSLEDITNCRADLTVWPQVLRATRVQYIDLLADRGHAYLGGPKVASGNKTCGKKWTWQIIDSNADGIGRRPSVEDSRSIKLARFAQNRRSSKTWNNRV